MNKLKQYFITSNQNEYREGEVHRFCQNIKISQPIQVATLTATALGIYEMNVNGEKVGEQLFAPGFTYYHRDLFYQTYDVTAQLQVGDNQLDAWLGQGWYAGRFTHENLTKIYGEQTAISWVLQVTYADGTEEKFVSDEKVEEYTSKYRYAGFYDGEIYDATATEQRIGTAQNYTGKIPENLEKTLIPVKLQEEMHVHQVTEKDGKTILDFGQNFAGILEIDPSYLNGKATINIRHGEILNEDGSLYTENLREAKAELVVTLAPDSPIYRPTFTYMGFRYVEISGVKYQPGLIKAHAIYSEMKRTGTFETSNAKVQRLYENQLWGQKSNYVEVPTDCPQRDERQGYTGDGQVFARTGAYNYDTEVFWQKFLRDIHYSQLDNSEGYIGATIPANGPTGIGFLSMLGWGNAITIVPKLLQEQYGTEEYLKQYYPNMKKFVEAELSRLGDDLLWLEPNLGDWLMHGKDIVWMAGNHGPVSNSFIVNDLAIITELAEKFGYAEDAIRYASYLEKVREAYIQTFFQADGTVLGDYQGGYIMALQYVLPEGELRERALEKLIAHVKGNGMQTGFFSTEFILSLLVEAGETKLAYDLLLDETFPSWLHQVNQGATTMWERWDAIREDGTVNEDAVSTSSANMVSFNHYAFGSVGAFYYQHILGIQPLEPGFSKVLLQPIVDERLGDAKGVYESRAGKIESAWEIKENHVAFTFTTPVESVIVLPDGQTHEVMPGTYTYEVKGVSNEHVS